jgi:tetratricopeptide (TPR) repeat protein
MNFDDYVGQGIAFFKKGENGLAIENFKAALALQPDNPDLQSLIRLSEEKAMQEAQYSQAKENQAKALEGLLGIKVEDVDKAIAEYTEALKRSPNDASAEGDLANAFFLRGLTFTAKGEHACAIADYSEAIKYESNPSHTLKERGQAYLNNGDFDKAIADFEEMIRLDPNYDGVEIMLANAYGARGRAHDKKGDYDRAISDYEKSLKLKPDSSSMRELLEMAKADKARR